ncbi:MAG: hypothetical protein KDK08_00135 [Rhizobiaceae bacterium]|nr:hypothetical protein [Rhizobiaceae bacterium]
MAKAVNYSARASRTPRTPTQFVLQCWQRHTSGYCFLATKSAKTGTWRDHSFELPVAAAGLSKHFRTYPLDEFDHYLCLNAFRRDRRLATFCLPTPWAWVDVDEHDPYDYPVRPSVVLETSTGSFQAFWLFQKRLKALEAQALSKHLAYMHGGDRNGHSSTKLLRIPFTRNHKPERNGETVRLLEFDLKPIDRAKLGKLSHVKFAVYTNREPSTGTIRAFCSSAPEIIEKYRRKLHPRVRFLTDDRPAMAFEKDRSKCVFEIVAGLHEAGAEPWEITSVLVVNPYFAWKHGINWDVAQAEVQRILPKLRARK